jgi:flavin reductase (DIM6/NTAB) family NADH-FMN oxidoreductase RutF
MRRLLLVLAAFVCVGALASTTFGGPSAPPAISIDVSPVEAIDGSGADVSYHVKSKLDLDVTCTPTGGPGTDFTATAHFPVGDSIINCSDTDGNTQDATATVQDTTPPVIASHGDVSAATATATTTVHFDPPAANDAVDGAVPVSCTPASDSYQFPIGTTVVTCTAIDAHNNHAVPTHFNVNVADTGAPTLSVVPPDPTEATGPSGATVNYTISASDNSGVTPNIDCAGHEPGSSFPLGVTTVTCKATDAASNSTTAPSFTVTVQDTTPPTLTLPSNITVEADSASGKIVTYSASASDTVSGALPANCSPASGSAFPIGTTTVNCSATDGAGKSASGSFTVTVTDSTGPAFSGVPADRQVEANGPGGSVVNYTTPTATDATDGPEVATCLPASGSTFPLGTSTVTCSATDGHGNTSTASFSVSVVDTTKPTLIVPADRAVYADTPDGISAQSHYVAAFLSEAQAVDSVDPNPHVSSNAPDFFTVGVHFVIFTASDASGNAVSKGATLEVRPMPDPGTPPLPTPPARNPPKDVTGLKADAGDKRVRLSWQIPDGVDHVVVTHQLSAGGDTQVIYTGSAESFTDRGLVNGLEYRYVVVSVDKNGNSSAGVAVVALPKATLLRSPRDGARLKKPPKLVWVRNSEASYYNVQVYRGAVKILSTWPVKSAVTLKRSWKYQGHRYTLTPGVYRWYVWPGFGARSAVDYGDMLGFSSFQIVR